MREQQRTGAVVLGGEIGGSRRRASREARRVGRAGGGGGARGFRGAAVEAGRLQGGAAALSLREALVVPVQAQILHRHQLTCHDRGRGGRQHTGLTHTFTHSNVTHTRHQLLFVVFALNYTGF